ncbi:hypothetical protein RB195_010868 [Necator americanus]
MSQNKEQLATSQSGSAKIELDRKKHKQAVKKQRLIKQKRRMKMTDRGDDIHRDPEDSDDFIASDIPEETPQDLWLNDLLNSPSPTRNKTSALTKPPTPGNGDHSTFPNQSTSIQRDSSLSSLISKAVQTIANYPVEFALSILVLAICRWIYIYLSKKKTS